jgi:hypothetical protein
VEDIVLTNDAYFVRAYNADNGYITGRWMISIEDMNSFSSVDDFIEKTALPIVSDPDGLIPPGTLVKPNQIAIVRDLYSKKRCSSSRLGRYGTFARGCDSI